jgi:hypothetical protein
MTAPPSLYRRAMGGEFDKLALPLQRFHSLAGAHTLQGEVDVEAPTSALARMLAFFMGTPLESTHGAIRFELVAGPDTETWTRHFPGRSMTSRFSAAPTAVVEQMGPARLTFALSQTEGRLKMHLARMQFLRIPCPGWLMPRIVAEESGEADRLHFHVQATVPAIGRVASYRGYLRVPPE